MYWLRIGSITLLTFRRLVRLLLRLRFVCASCFVRVLVVRFFGEREIDLVAFFVDHVGVVDEELRAPSPGQHQSVPPPTHPAFPGRAAPSRASARAARRGAAISASTSSSVGFDRFLRDDRAQREVGEHATRRALRAPRRRTLPAPGRWPARYCSSADLLVRQPVREILDAPARLALDERRRALRSARGRRRLRAPCRARPSAPASSASSRGAGGCRRAARRRCRTRSPRRPTRR